MTEIYKLITENDNKFRLYAYKFTRDKNEIDEVVQELMLYYLSMNKDTLKTIFDKDGIKGIIGYGCIVIKRLINTMKKLVV